MTPPADSPFHFFRLSRKIICHVDASTSKRYPCLSKQRQQQCCSWCLNVFLVIREMWLNYSTDPRVELNVYMYSAYRLLEFLMYRAAKRAFSSRVLFLYQTQINGNTHTTLANINTPHHPTNQPPTNLPVKSNKKKRKTTLLCWK